ncbi:YhbY family RNA-binding protein [Kallipyga gabonensis]|uniref:YhbY family RNA-binding protein n=1 Tax=Kallipyga gabonensis TaxID=1686287 RepID=UPI0006B6422A|nr:YhbY family RNA-binding protein [Kallipyga gabonensis]
MLTGKQRSYLKSLSNGLQSTLIIGKDGITKNTLKELEDQLTAKELVKMTFLDTAGVDPEDEVDRILEILDADFVSHLGSKLVIYRPSKNVKIRLPK